jgi:TolA-binding protein
MLKAGYAYLALGEPAKARTLLEQVITIYPRSNPAVLAAQRLETLDRK